MSIPLLVGAPSLTPTDTVNIQGEQVEIKDLYHFSGQRSYTIEFYNVHFNGWWGRPGHWERLRGRNRWAITYGTTWQTH